MFDVKFGLLFSSPGEGSWKPPTDGGLTLRATTPEFDRLWHDGWMSVRDPACKKIEERFAAKSGPLADVKSAAGKLAESERLVRDAERVLAGAKLAHAAVMDKAAVDVDAQIAAGRAVDTAERAVAERRKAADAML